MAPRAPVGARRRAPAGAAVRLVRSRGAGGARRRGSVRGPGPYNDRSARMDAGRRDLGGRGRRRWRRGASWDDPRFGLRLGASAEPPLRSAWLGVGASVPVRAPATPAARSSGAMLVLPEAGAALLAGPWRFDVAAQGAWAPRFPGDAWVSWEGLAQGVVAHGALRLNGGPVVPRVALVSALAPADAELAARARLELAGGALLDLSRGLGVGVEGRGRLAGDRIDAVGAWRSADRGVDAFVDVRW